MEGLFNSNPDEVIYRFTRVLFGLNWSPFLLNATKNEHMSKYTEVYNDVNLIEKFLRDTYVDDVTTSFNDSEMALQFAVVTERHMKEGGFSLRKWESNDENVRATMKRCDEVEGKVLPQGNSTGRKVLGLNWDVNFDKFEFEFS